MLVGRWSGDYQSPALGRRGSIEFQLVAGDAQARGDVVMIPAGSGRSYEPLVGAPEDQAPASRPLPQGLTIRFVKSAGGIVTGSLDPYWDPDRNCRAVTVFLGRLTPGVIEGTFTTDLETGMQQVTGTWRVTRKPNR